MADVKIIQGYEKLQSELQAKPDTMYIVFYANAEGDKVSWCPDCVKGVI